MPGFNLGLVREDITDHRNTAIEQSHYGQVVPTKKCLAGGRNLSKEWLPPEGDICPLFKLKSGGRWPRVDVEVPRGLQGPRIFPCLPLIMSSDALMFTSVASF